MFQKYEDLQLKDLRYEQEFQYATCKILKQVQDDVAYVTSIKMDVKLNLFQLLA